MSLALAHKRKTLGLGEVAVAVAAVASALPYSSADALSSPANAKKHLALQEAALDVDLKRLSDIKQLALRQELKRSELLPKYQPYIQRYCESGVVMRNRVLVQVMVWLFDTAQFDDGLELAEIAIAQGQLMPERFKRRDIQTFVADAVCEWAYEQYSRGRSPEPYLSDFLVRVDGDWRVTEQIPSKYHKLLGIRAQEAGEFEKALHHLERARTLYAKACVDTRIKECTKALAKEQAAAGGQ